MLRGLRAWLRGLLGGESDDEATDEERRFVPSRLDVSVRDAHGGQDGAGERELAAVSETARELEDGTRER